MGNVSAVIRDKGDRRRATCVIRDKGYTLRTKFEVIRDKGDIQRRTFLVILNKADRAGTAGVPPVCQG